MQRLQSNFSVGGYNGETRLKKCKKYVINENKLVALPELYLPRYFCGVVIMDNSNLYAIKGEGSDG